MKALTYSRPETAAAAVQSLVDNPDARYLGGGTNLVDHLKLGVASPGELVDVSRLPLDRIEEIDEGTALRIGANVRNSDLAAHPLIRSRYPAVSRALLSGASGQIRNQATTAGNLLQRTRCVYFQDVTTSCNKREPGSGCSAIGGYERYNAVLGASEGCAATHPSDLAVALTALDASVTVLGPDGDRRVPIEALHRLPGNRPDLETTLRPGELITGVDLPEEAATPHSTYRKVRDRASFAFALVSVAALLEVDDGVVNRIQLAWGGVAHKPWRAREVEEALTGAELTEGSIAEAVDAELSQAVTTEQTAYKVPMLHGATTSTLMRLAEGQR